MAPGGRSAAKKPAGNRRGKATPPLEWIASGLGLVLIAAVLSFLAWDIIQQDGGPVSIVVEAGRVTQVDAGFALEIRVRNTSPGTAAEVEIQGVLGRSGETRETARVRLDYVAGHSSRDAALLFTGDPRVLGVELRALGYARP